MKYTIGTAARAVGKSKSSVHRDLNDGKLSAERNDDGTFSIDASELMRVYGDAFDPNRSKNAKLNDTERPKNPIGTGGVEVELAVLRERLSLSNIERERERDQLNRQIEDLQRRLDAEADARRVEGEERRKLTAILTDQRTKEAEPTAVPAAAAAPEPPQPKGLRGLLRRLVG